MPAFEETYGFRLRRTSNCLTLSGGNTAATLRARRRADVGGQRRDGLRHRWALAALDLTALEDDKGCAGGLCPGSGRARTRCSASTRKSRLYLTRCSPRLTLETLQQLNAEIAVDGKDAGAVATAYLKSKHFPPVILIRNQVLFTLVMLQSSPSPATGFVKLRAESAGFGPTH